MPGCQHGRRATCTCGAGYSQGPTQEGRGHGFLLIKYLATTGIFKYWAQGYWGKWASHGQREDPSSKNGRVSEEGRRPSFRAADPCLSPCLYLLVSVLGRGLPFVEKKLSRCKEQPQMSVEATSSFQQSLKCVIFFFHGNCLCFLKNGTCKPAYAQDKMLQGKDSVDGTQREKREMEMRHTTHKEERCDVEEREDRKLPTLGDFQEPPICPAQLEQPGTQRCMDSETLGPQGLESSGLLPDPVPAPSDPCLFPH